MHSAELLSADGWTLLFLGSEPAGSENLRIESNDRATVLTLKRTTHSRWAKLDYVGFVFWATFWTIRWRPSWLYASDLFSCFPALFLSFLPGVRAVYHEHDSPGETAASTFFRACLWARKHVASRSDVVVLPNETRAKAFQAAHPKAQRVHTVWNCPLPSEVGEPRTDFHADDFWLYYHGSIVPVRLPCALVEALALLPANVRLRIAGYETIGSAGYVDSLLARARDLGVDSRIEYLGTLPVREDLFALARRSHVGLALMPTIASDLNEQAMTGASNKPFDYLASGMCLLVSNLPDWNRMFVEPGYGVKCDPDDPASIARAVAGLLADREGARRRGEAGRQRILDDWNYERTFQPVREWLNRAG